MSDRVLMWVSPEFKKFIKKKAIDNNKSVIEFTDDLAKHTNKLESDLSKSLKKINDNWSRLI